MTKFEKLKAVYEAATPGEWEAQTYVCFKAGEPERGISIYVGEDSFGSFEFGDAWSDEELAANTEFMARAHNMMPNLLEAIELLKVAAHALETPGDFSPEELEEQVKGDISAFLARLEESDG